MRRHVLNIHVLYIEYMYSGAGTGPRGGRDATRGNLEAAVHRHTLDRVNAINDSLKKIYVLYRYPFARTCLYRRLHGCMLGLAEISKAFLISER